MAIWTNYTSKSTPADNDTLLEYDATGRALKQTPFSGVYNWLQAKIHALTASTGAWAPSTDKLLTDRNGTLSRIDYSVLAKAIVEEYAGSSVAGSNQAIKTALDSLNSNTYALLGGTEIAENTDLNSLTTPGNYYCKTNGVAATLMHCPTNGSAFTMKVEYGTGTGTPKQTIRPYNSNNIYCRYNNTASWELVPTRAEMDTVTTALSTVYFFVENIDAGTVTYNVPQSYRGILYVLDSVADHNGIYILSSTGSGAVNKKDISAATDIDFNTSTAYKLSITVSSGTRKMVFMDVVGRHISRDTTS